MSCDSLVGVNFGSIFKGQEQSMFYVNILGNSVGSTVPRKDYRSMTYELRFSDLSKDTYS